MIRKSFKRELFFCFILVALVPLIISSFFLVKLIEARLTSDYEKETQIQLELVETILEDYFQEIDVMINNIIGDQKIIDSLLDIDLWTRNKAYKQLYSETSSVREKAQIDVYDNQGICRLSTTSTVVEGRMPTYWGVLRVARIHRDDMIIKNAIATNQDSSILLQAARAVIYEEDVIGYVVVNIKEEHFETLLLGTYDGRNGIAILDEYWEAVYSTKTAKEEDISQVLRKRRMNGEKVKQETDAITFLIKSMENHGLYLVLGRENIFTEDIMHTTVGMIFILASLSLLLCLCVAIFMSAYLTVPIDKLIKAMKKVESGQLEIQIDSEREDELGQLSESFDKMTRELKEYMELRVRQQQELNDSNIAMMQAQLNPHFLYNTLDTMKWVAKANNIPEIATLAASLAKILRVSISDEKFIPLLNEVEIINHYMEIQKIRFDGNFSFDVELPFELEDCLVPKLIIQPIVENAILHGFKDKKEGHIFLNIYKVDNVLYIEVSDDGCGISLDIVKQLNNREKLKGHIGFFNVDTIIRLYYGCEFGVSVQTLLDGGTLVRISLPIIKEEYDV